ncbi:hypothetical protein HK100_002138 [Physocladia obscura]|uniref:N-acetyltransferase domain-containing protein n=1 Tax=Physocladia obscura TaxID=109957 RepID=A0AAD5SXU8_9FUNG|nr:hypothetical protein HK100_002138 [Physocladia obscura]
MTESPELPPYARAAHRIETPRLILRSLQVDDAAAFTQVYSNPLNSPFGGAVGNKRTEAEQRANIEKQALSTARGENAWLVVILKPDQVGASSNESDLKQLRVHDGFVIGSAGFNMFHVVPESATLLSDIGALIDYRFHRRALAMETLQAVIEYGFSVLGVTVFTLETNAENVPFRALMERLGVPIEKITEGGRGHGEEGDEASYRFGLDEWKVMKQNLIANSKWYL